MLMKTMRMKLPIGKAKAYLPKRENTNSKVHPHQNTIFVAGIQKCREKLGVRSITRSTHLGKLAGYIGRYYRKGIYIPSFYTETQSLRDYGIGTGTTSTTEKTTVV
jgi:hypothetical protein